MRFARGNVRDPHRISEKRPRSFVSTRARIAAAESSKNQHLRDFRRRSIFDFCNTIEGRTDMPLKRAHLHRFSQISDTNWLMRKPNDRRVRVSWCTWLTLELWPNDPFAPTAAIRPSGVAATMSRSEGHLRHILLSYMKYYNEVRTHLSLDKDTPVSRAVERSGHILCRPILGGLHHQYIRI
jgi:hypothetical protein